MPLVSLLSTPATASERRLALLLMSPELILRLLTTGADEHTWITTDGVPTGAEIRNVAFSAEHNAFAIALEHPDFDVVHDGAMLPVLNPLLTIHRLPVVHELPNGAYYALDFDHMPIIVRKVEDA